MTQQFGLHDLTHHSSRARVRAVARGAGEIAENAHVRVVVVDGAERGPVGEVCAAAQGVERDVDEQQRWTDERDDDDDDDERGGVGGDDDDDDDDAVELCARSHARGAQRRTRG